MQKAEREAVLLVSFLSGCNSMVVCFSLQLDEEEERRKRRREKNKVAAARCRNKKKERTEFLQRVSASAWELSFHHSVMLLSHTHSAPQHAGLSPKIRCSTTDSGALT